MMIKKTLYFLILLSFSLLMRAQAPPSYTNVTFGQPIRQNTMVSIQPKYNQYYAMSINALVNSPWEMDVYTLDLLGSIINHKNIALNNKSLGVSKDSKIVFNNSDSSLFIAGSIYDDYTGGTAPHSHGMLWKLNKNMDTLWHKSFANINDSAIIFASCLLSKNGLILFGQSTEFDVNGDDFIMKVDFNGNILFKKTYQIPNQFGGITKLIKTKDSCYVAVENLLDCPTWGYSDIKLTKYDTAFNIKWQRIINTPYLDALGEMIELSDSNLVISSGYCMSQFNAPWGTNYNKHCLTKINNHTGATIWQKLYGVARADIQLYNILETPNKKLMALGHTVTAYASKPSGTFIATMLVTNQYGDSLNYQETFSDSISKNNYLLDLAPTTNGYYCVGQTSLPVYTGTTITSWEQQNWLVKADTNGCFNPNCVLDVSVDELSLNHEQRMWLYPNPSNTTVNIQLPKHIDKFDNTNYLILYDATGKEILNQPIYHQNFSLDVSGFAKGFYMATISSGNIILCTHKLIIN
jgi:hypothetical protein